jgi:hypothetical protein
MMIVVKVDLRDYAIEIDYLISLAKDFFGNLLATEGSEEDGIMEFGFEGDGELAAYEKISTADMARKNAALFHSILNAPNWKIVKDSS